MVNIWEAVREDDVGEVEWLVGQDPCLLNAGDHRGRTPLYWASWSGHVGVVRWLVDKGAAINERDSSGGTALWIACDYSRAPVVKLLMERGADPTIASNGGATPMIAASENGHLEVVRFLLGLPSAKATINHSDNQGKTAWHACYWGCWGAVRALLESGADPTIASNNGITPRATASAEGRRKCVAALKVSFCVPLSLPHPLL
jgi:ankyrin repeat protein